MSVSLGATVWLIAVASGAAAGLGVWAVVGGLVPRPVRLGDALGRLDVTAPPAPRVEQVPRSWGDRLGWWVVQRAHLPLSLRTRRLLELQRRTPADLAAEKAAFAVIGMSAPLLFALVCVLLDIPAGPLPAVIAVVGAAVGWFVPDLRLTKAAPAVQADAGEALCTFVDLVALERLANQSSTQALSRAASVSDHPLFSSLRLSLDRARLEQRPAWQALRDVGTHLDLPQLSELADVIRLDEHGAALSGILRSRAEELRDSHLMSEKIAAQQVSESMTIWMVLPAMVFGLIFLVPPLMKLLAS